MLRTLAALVLGLAVPAAAAQAEFIKGADLSLLQSLQDHGVQYKEAGRVKDPLSLKRCTGTDIEGNATAAGPVATRGGPVTARIDCRQAVNTMRGGLGASWHAIEAPIPFGVKHPLFNSYSHGGSGWGGYPPAEDERAWQQIYRHASWLGLDWNRVEVEQRIYEPDRDRFTFDSPEMRILYRILDWNEKNHADVFLQQMWCNAAWLAYAEFRDDPVGRVHSAPADIDAFADGLAALMEHLVKKRGYTCIKWLCINNEPGGGFSWWNAPPNKPLSIKSGLEAVRKALDKHGLQKLPLSGPDVTIGGFPASAPGKFDFLPTLGAYDFHDYSADFDFRSHGHIAQQEQNAAVWAKYAHAQGKPVFLSEFGTMAYGWVPDQPGPSCPQAVLAGSELVVRMLNCGVDGMNRWSFLNRGDLDGQWQFVDTWDRKAKKLLKDFVPHPNSYFCLGLLSRFTAKHSTVLASRVEGGRIDDWQRVFVLALRSPSGNLTLAAVNDARAAFDLKLAIEGLSSPARFYRYRYGEAERNERNVTIDPQKEYPLGPANPQLQDALPPNSLTIYSTYRLEHGEAGVIDDDSPKNKTAFRPLVFACEGASKIVILADDGTVRWEYPAEMSRDAWRLPGGNVLFCYNNQYQSGRNDNPSGVMEVSPDKKVVFHFRTTGQVWSCQRLADGNTLVGASSQGKLLIVDPHGQVVKTIELRNKPGHSCLRNARQLASGNFLAAEESAHAVREYSPVGALVREIQVPFSPYSAVRLANGNTIACGQKSMVEVDPAGHVVWSLADSEIPQMGIRWFAGIQVLPDGSILVCNAGGKVPFFEVNRQKQIVWRWPSSGPAVGLGHGIQRLDVLGDPIK